VRELALQKQALEQEKFEYQLNLEAMISRRTADLDKSMQSTIKVMTSLVDSRDPYTSGHQIRVATSQPQLRSSSVCLPLPRPASA
ncbi:MAG: hypothetical protein LRY35_03975, partial [Clostridiales bacterium]|nr:hypothetical protein [Clostridiales bacterium]